MSLPNDFLIKMKKLLGAEYEEFLSAYEMPKVTGIRVNPLKVTSKESACELPFQLKKISWAAEGYSMKNDNGLRPGKHPFHEAGVYYMQEPSAMAPAEQLSVQPGERVLDLCAAPGGKSTQLAGKLQGQGFLLANEIHPARAQILSQNMERLGIGNAVVTNETPDRLAARFTEYFHKVLVDAPCSGEGMFRKDENASGEWSLANVQKCAERQAEVLHAAAMMCRKGGTLVYSTCTFSPEENEQTVVHFLQNHPEFSLCKPLWFEGFSSGRQEWAECDDISVTDTVRLWPHKLHGEGHFMAVFRKEGVQEEEKVRYPQYFKDKKKLADYESFAKSYLTEKISEPFVVFGDQLYRIPEEMLQYDKLKVVRPGLHIGTFLKNRFEPSHALALYCKKEQVKQWIDLDWDSKECLAYLKGETIQCDDSLKGWVLVCCNGYSLGWGKANNGTLKNHYPKGLRWM